MSYLSVFAELPQVMFYTSMFLHRPGVLPRQKLLRACKLFRGKERRSTVLVDAGAENGELYIAVIIMFLTCVFEGRKRKCAMIRWYQKFGRVNGPTGCTVVVPEKMKSIFGRSRTREVSSIFCRCLADVLCSR